jgi:glycosyltransferase involved in cell wall biosynthesis
LKLLVTAISFCPGEGSEPGVGWHTVCAFAAEHEVTVLTDAQWKAKHDPAAWAHLPVTVHYVASPFPLALLRGELAWTLYYYLWQVAAYLTALRLHKQQQFDAAQHITFVKCTTPTMLALLPIPFIQGPVGGAELAPSSFYAEFSWKERLKEALRTLSIRVAAWDPLIRLCNKRSALSLAVTPATAEALRGYGSQHVGMLPAVALSAAEIAAIRDQTDSSHETELTLLYVGRLIPWKGLHLGLRALALVPGLRLRVIGDGPLKPWLTAEAQRLGIAERVEFTGPLPRSEVLKAYASARGFLFPSLHDSGGNAVLEAMAAALPILCLRYGGPDALVPEEAGWKIAADTPEAAVAGIATALTTFRDLPDQRQQKGQAARAHCLTHHTWATHSEQLLSAIHSLQNI